MTTRAFLLVVGLLWALAGAAQAQWRVRVVLSPAQPVQQSLPHYATGFGGIFSWQYAGNGQTAFGLEVGHLSLSGRDTVQRLSITPIGLNLNHSFLNHRFQPFVGAGIGYALLGTAPERLQLPGGAPYFRVGVGLAWVPRYRLALVLQLDYWLLASGDPAYSESPDVAWVAPGLALRWHF